MGLLEGEASSSFLSCEARDEAKREKHDRDAAADALEIAAIEQAFATAIGPEAVSELARINSASYDAFDRTGKKPMASPGYRYNSFSQELVPEKVISPMVEKRSQ
jgi:hypothetical protein